MKLRYHLIFTNTLGSRYGAKLLVSLWLVIGPDDETLVKSFRLYILSQLLGQARVLVELRIEDDEMNAAVPEGEVVVAEIQSVSGYAFRSRGVS